MLIIAVGKYLYISVYRGSLILGLNLVVLISFNLGLLNLMPIPVLDGGHIVFGLIEMALGRPLPNSLIKILSNIFVALLIGLMIFVTFSDSKRLYREFFPPSADGESKHAKQQTPKP